MVYWVQVLHSRLDGCWFKLLEVGTWEDLWAQPYDKIPRDLQVKQVTTEKLGLLICNIATFCLDIQAKLRFFKSSFLSMFRIFNALF